MDISLTAKNKPNGVCIISMRGDIGAETVNDFKLKDKTIRIINELLDDNLLEKEGEGKSTLYFKK